MTMLLMQYLNCTKVIFAFYLLLSVCIVSGSKPPGSLPLEVAPVPATHLQSLSVSPLSDASPDTTTVQTNLDGLLVESHNNTTVPRNTINSQRACLFGPLYRWETMFT